VTKLPRIAFCITCKNRTQHLELTLPENLVDNARYPNAVFVVLDYNSQDNLLPFLSGFKDVIEANRLVVYSYREPGPFKMAHAKNMAHRLGMLEGADILVNLDADNFTGPDFAGYIAEQFNASPPDTMFLWSKMIREGPDRLPRGISGRIAVSRNAFLKSGGYDEQFNTWGPDDKDFHLRLRRLGYDGVEIDRKYLSAILHNDKMRFREYPEVCTPEDSFNQARFKDVVNLPFKTVTNYGRYGMGAVFRNFDATNSATLEALPTRIFGIGMQKTATNSLSAALKILGFDSAHWDSAHWVKAIWTEMSTRGVSPVLERSYAMSDIPFNILFKQLDIAYPGSKFILTVRDPNKWLASVENHWNPDKNTLRKNWDNDPFSHQAHKLVYGQKGFDPTVFMARYLRHNAEVIEYFRNRPSDLLVMRMDRGAGWRELCSFLDCSVPSGEYPKAFVTKE
jgi:hypothetical protein